MSDTPAIELENLTKAYGNLVAVNNLNLKVEKKQVHGFLGPNGAGKTTTIKMLVGLLKPNFGSMKILGQDAMGDHIKIRKKMGFMPELPRFPKHLSGIELLNIYGKMYGISKDERKKQIPELIKMVGLEGRGKDRIGKYSKGMQQRIGIAQALIGSPELVILDEPSIGLDPVGMVEVRDLVKQIVKTGKTIFFSSHLLAEVQQICDHVTVINKGKLLYTGPLEGIAGRVKAKRKLVVEVLHPSRLITESLQGLPYAKVELKGNIYTIELDTREDVRAEISLTITTAKGIIVEMREEGGGLEDIFLHLIGKDGLNHG